MPERMSSSRMRTSRELSMVRFCCDVRQRSGEHERVKLVARNLILQPRATRSLVRFTCNSRSVLNHSNSEGVGITARLVMPADESD